MGRSLGTFVAGIALGAAGCMPAPAGALLGMLMDPGVPLGDPAPLGERPIASGGLLFVGAELGPLDRDEVSRWAIESSDPDVIEVPLAGELLDPGEQTDERIDPGAPAAWIEGDEERGETIGVALRAGAPGDATLSLVDTATGLVLSSLDVEVRAPAAVVAVPRGAAYWDVLRGLRPRILDGSIVNFDVVATDDLGRPLAGVGAGHGRGTLVASADGGAPTLGVGLHQLAVDGLPPVEIEVVDRASIAGIELLEEPEAGALIAVAIDGEGEPVLGAFAGWSQGKEEERGDLYAYRPDPHAEAVAVTAALDGHRATAWVRQAAPGEVRRSDASGCSSAGAPTGWALGLLGAALALRRRVRRSR